MSKQKLSINWDKETDIMCCVREGYDLDSLINEDSLKVPGIVKRVDPESGKCVGFIMHGFSRLLPAQNLSEEQIKELLNISLDLTNQPNLSWESRTTAPSLLRVA